MNLFVITAAIALAATTPSPAPSVTPSVSSPPTASPAPPPFHLSVDSFTNFIDTSANGPGLVPPEAPGFIKGSPLSPNSAYDVFSSAPQMPGISGIAQANVRGDYVGKRYDATAILGLGYVTGNTQNALYWGENLMPTLNPHLGYTALPYTIAFPTRAGQGDASAAAISPLFASFGARDGSWLLRGGFFHLTQTDRFTFVEPPLTNVIPNIGLQTAESLGNGPASLDSWPAPPPGLPLHGIDLTMRRGIASLEVTNAALPALPGSSARASIGSLVFDHGEGTRYSFSFVHVATSGDPIFTTTLFGVDPHVTPGPQGSLPESMLGGQTETIAGARASFHLSRHIDSAAEIGRTWYNADSVAEPGTNRPGGFYHLGFSHKAGRTTIGVDGYRFEARYANAILPYGTPENVWSAAWAWPGVWLKSNYQLVDNLQAPGSNRQGYRLHYASDGGPLEVHVAFSMFRQIEPATFGNMQQAGFVDGFFLPQMDNAATLGNEHQYNAWIAWHRPYGDVTLDYANDHMHRDATPGHPEDAVTYQAPQVVLTLTHAFGKFAVADAGFGRYAMKGTWAQPYTNVDYFQNVVFVGAQLRESPVAIALVQVRRSQFDGLPSLLGGPSPRFAAITLVFEQRVHL